MDPELKLDPPEHKAGVLTTGMQRSITDRNRGFVTWRINCSPQFNASFKMR
jgi:hypothetical protein